MPQKRELTGTIVSNRMQKTLVVRVERMKRHPLYRKFFRTSRTYKVHDETGGYQIGDEVRFVECRPISKEKRWRVVGHVS